MGNDRHEKAKSLMQAEVRGWGKVLSYLHRDLNPGQRFQVFVRDAVEVELWDQDILGPRIRAAFGSESLPSITPQPQRLAHIRTWGLLPERYMPNEIFASWETQLEWASMDGAAAKLWSEEGIRQVIIDLTSSPKQQLKILPLQEKVRSVITPNQIPHQIPHQIPPAVQDSDMEVLDLDNETEVAIKPKPIPVGTGLLLRDVRQLQYASGDLSRRFSEIIARLIEYFGQRPNSLIKDQEFIEAFPELANSSRGSLQQYALRISKVLQDSGIFRRIKGKGYIFETPERQDE